MKTTKLYLYFVFLSLIGFILSLSFIGCIPPSYATFINNTEQPITIEASWLIDSKTTDTVRIIINPHESRKISVLLTEWWNICGFDSQRSTIFNRHISFTPQYIETYASNKSEQSLPSGWQIYFLVTGKDIYSIPKQYHNTWKEHLDEIMTTN